MSNCLFSASLRLCEKLFSGSLRRMALPCILAVVFAVPLKAAEETPATPVAVPPPYAEPADESDKYNVETIATGLDNPCAIALRPGSPDGTPYELYLSESGAGRILRVASDKPGESLPVINDFPTDEYGDTDLEGDPVYRIGPLGLVFLTRTKLAVGTAGLPQGEDLVRVYALPEDGEPLTYDQVDHAVGPIPKGERTKTGEGNFYGLAKTDDALFVTSNGDDDEAWVLKARLIANRLTDLQPFIATNRLLGVTGPVAATVNPKPRAHYLVIGQMGDLDPIRDSLVTMYGPESGEVALNLQTGLYDVAGLAYSPTGDLYAVDLVRNSAELGGVYRLDAAEVDGRQSCRAVKIAAAQRPTALAFGPDGALYVTAIGDRQDPERPPTGVLLKITPKPETPKL